MVGVLSNKVGRDELKPGDHIYSWRSAYLYSHHGIYIGDEKVVHFTRAAGQEIGTGTVLDLILFSSSPTTHAANSCDRCTAARDQHQPELRNCSDGSAGGGVIISCLDCFLDGGNLYLFTYNVSPAFFLAKARGGTCTLAGSDVPDVVVHRALFLLTRGFGAYCLFKNNCEDFAIYCKTGLLVETAFSVGRSGQLTSITAAISAVASSPLRFLTTSAGGLAIVTTSMYCMGRYIADIGVRRDVLKVPVERLVEHVHISAQEAPSVPASAAASPLGTTERS
ncbi:hypothetical protein LUZ63_015706 [Rhynchospora breviuscula]|uniref:LRAT domain-containing protein n=1 Tax=Rhynchospora breviuscula TaxID=2022672 RepID=A0A9Q0CCU7_9POAL|nr:hypothetical protein LUZ63_015706 [Rhynchospora breviuscula]